MLATNPFPASDPGTRVLQSLHEFNGITYGTERKSFRDLTEAWVSQGEGKDRDRKSRVTMVGSQAVLKIDNYDRLGTNLSVFDLELSGRGAGIAPQPKPAGSGRKQGPDFIHDKVRTRRQLCLFAIPPAPCPGGVGAPALTAIFLLTSQYALL